jgi:Holliday junction DNA helicase RuvA
MLAYINGKVVAKLAGKVIVKVPAGVGYLITVSPNQNYLENENIELFLLEINTKETPELYGFISIDERDWVEKLLKVSGVGPKMAAKIVYHLGVGRIIEAINDSNSDILTEVPGLGAKTAKKIVIEFKGASANIKKFDASEVNLTNDFTIDFVDTLSGLGYKRGEIVSIITRLKRKKAWDETNLIETVKKGLEELGRGR